jgi:putative inorganic carbon (HCO3(-)) transporter
MSAASLAASERWFLRAGAFALPLGFGWETFDQYVLPKLLIARVLVLGLLLLLVVRAAVSGQVEVKRTPLDLPLLAFAYSAVLSTVFAENQNIAIFGTYSRYDGLLTLLTYVALFWLVVQTLRTADDARALLRVLLASGYFVAVIAILQSVNNTFEQGAVVPAFGTMGNSNVLGAFLAMTFVLALADLIGARSISARILLANVLIVVGLALLLSFSRSGWLGAALGAIIVIARESHSISLRVAVISLGVVAAGLAIALVAGGGFELQRLLVARAMTLFDLHEWGGSRLHIWLDSLQLIGSRPIVGVGPDNFGLVYPRFQTGDWGRGIRDAHQQIDKTHAEMLQVAATQGILGVAAYLWILVAFVRSFWKGRHMAGAAGVFGAFVAYQATIQLNFTAPASAFPFWILAAAAVTIFGTVSTWSPLALSWQARLSWRAQMFTAAALIAAALIAACVPAVVNPYVADAHFRLAQDAAYVGDRDIAWTLANSARSLAPRESVYAVEVANVAIDRHDLLAARAAYIDAVQLGTYNPFVYRNLALVDIQLGRRAEALSAARMAAELNRFDPANLALVAQLEAGS